LKHEKALSLFWRADEGDDGSESSVRVPGTETGTVLGRRGCCNMIVLEFGRRLDLDLDLDLDLGWC
jgi:hypothetical protein